MDLSGTFLDDPTDDQPAHPGGPVHLPDTAPTSPSAAEPFTLSPASPAYAVEDEDDGDLD